MTKIKYDIKSQKDRIDCPHPLKVMSVDFKITWNIKVTGMLEASARFKPVVSH